MRRFNFVGWKLLIILILFLATVVVFGVSFVMSIIEYRTAYAVTAVVSYLLVWVGIFGIEIYTNNYKLRYLFLGKEFNKMANEFFEAHDEISKKEKKRMLKQMKKEYRICGVFGYSIYKYILTPKKLWYEDVYAFSYGEALETQKEDYILAQLYIANLHGGGFCSVFEDLVKNLFSYDEYENLVKNSKNFSKKLKQDLLNSENKEIYLYYERYDELSDEEHAKIQEFETNGSNLVYEHQTEIFELVEKKMINDFMKLKIEKDLPTLAKSVFISNDGMNCVCVCIDIDAKAYKIVRGNFIFYQNDLSQIDSEGEWIFNEDASFYETNESALKEIKQEIKNYIQTK